VMHDLVARTNVALSDCCATLSNPTPGSNGTMVVFNYRPFSSATYDLRSYDFQSTQTLTVATGLSATVSVPAELSRDGRFVVFYGKAGGVNSIFVRDRLLGVTMTLGAGNGPSTRPVLAADGRTMVFQSFATDLAAGDYNDKRDIFVLKLGGVDSDGDGMDDDWEVAYFGNTSRPGSGDFDGDGASDLREFLAGTDPTNAGSVFRVLTVSSAGGGGKLLFWTGNPARSYRAEFKDDLSAPGWTALTGTISWSGSTANIIDPTATNSTHRYYRAIRLP
jgi:hypothetical protein